jgi:hypothetical protein
MIRYSKIPFELASEFLSYNPETGILTWKKDNLRVKAGSVAGFVHTGRGAKKYVVIKIKGKAYKAHRLAWLLTYGDLPPDQIDHENGDSCDNRIANLRSVNCTDNQRNARLREDNKSGACGVCFNKEKGKWTAQIRIGGKQKHLGGFVEFRDAVSARKKAEKLYGYHENHGRKDSACVNA